MAKGINLTNLTKGTILIIVINKSAGVVSLPVIIISVALLALILVSVSNWITKSNNKEGNSPNEQTETVNQVSSENEIPSPVKAFLSDENVKKLEGGGMSIYTGDNPPNVEGTYRFENIVFKYDPEGENFDITNYYQSFRNQKDDNTLIYSRSQNEAIEGPSSSEGKGVFISGEGNCFSIYLHNSTSSAGGCKFETVEIISACKEGGGLINMDWGVLWTEKEGQCPNEINPGRMRIFTQSTLAPKVE